MSNWKDHPDLAYDSDDQEAMKKHHNKLAKERTKAEMRAALNKARNHYEQTKINHPTDINKIRTAARALIVALKPYADNSSNASTIKEINKIIKDQLNRNFLKNLNSNAKGLAAAKQAYNNFIANNNYAYR